MKRILLSTVTLGLLAGFGGLREPRRKADHRREQPVLLDARRPQLGRHLQLRAAPRLLRPRAAHVAHAGRHRHLDGGRPGRLEQQGVRFVQRRLNSSRSRTLANTWNPAYQAINTLNAALDRGPNTTGHLAGGEEHAARRSALPPRARTTSRSCRQFGDVTLRCTRTRAWSSTAVRDPAADVYKAIIADLDTAVHSAAGDADRLRSRDQGRRADASLEGLSHARLSARTRRASRRTSRRRSPTRRPSSTRARTRSSRCSPICGASRARPIRAARATARTPATTGTARNSSSRCSSRTT